MLVWKQFQFKDCSYFFKEKTEMKATLNLFRKFNFSSKNKYCFAIKRFRLLISPAEFFFLLNLLRSIVDVTMTTSTSRSCCVFYCDLWYVN